MIEAAPLEQHLAGRDVDLLEHRVLDRPAPRAADRTQVRALHRVGRQQRRSPAGDQKLVQISAVAVARVHVRDRRVGGVGDHVAPDAVTERDVSLPPRQHRLALVGLHAKIGRDEMRQRLLPHRLPRVVHDHRPSLRTVWSVVRGEQDQPRRDRVTRCGVHRQRRDLQIRPTTVPRDVRSPRGADQSAKRPGRAAIRKRQRQRGKRRSTSKQQCPAGQTRVGACPTPRRPGRSSDCSTEGLRVLAHPATRSPPHTRVTTGVRRNLGPPQHPRTPG